MDQPTTIRFPPAIWERLRKAAFEQRIPMNRIVVTAVEKHLEDEQQ